MEGLSSYVVDCRSVIRVQAYTAQDAQDAALEILRRDGPDQIDVERDESEPSDRDYS